MERIILVQLSLKFPRTDFVVRKIGTIFAILIKESLGVNQIQAKIQHIFSTIW